MTYNTFSELEIENLHVELVDIDDIQNIGYKNTIDLAVDVEETFCVNDGIITHNSALSAVLSGFSEVDRNYFGAYPLKGKPLNVRGEAVSRILSHEGISNIITILGLQPGHKYKDKKELRYGHVIFMADRDCLHPDTIINTKNGNKKIKDVTVDDEVLTHTNTYKRVTEVVDKYKNEYVSFEINGQNIKCGLNHKWPVMRDGSLIVVCAKDIKPSDMFLIK